MEINKQATHEQYHVPYFKEQHKDVQPVESCELCKKLAPKSYQYEPEHEGICGICKKEGQVARRQYKPNQMMPIITSEQPICFPCFEQILQNVK